MVKSPEKTIIDKVKDTTAFIWAVRAMLVAFLTGGGFFITNAKELAGWLAKDTIERVVADTAQHLRSESKQIQKDTREQFNNLIVLLMESDPKFKQAAIEKADKEKTNETLLNAIKGVKK